MPTPKTRPSEPYATTGSPRHLMTPEQFVDLMSHNLAVPSSEALRNVSSEGETSSDVTLSE
eukprot:m.274596 g.274596  ORF g.274596 m.274596 type:complete len:61 (+) comp54835_c1_seq6:1551-1733(+)